MLNLKLRFDHIGVCHFTSGGPTLPIAAPWCFILEKKKFEWRRSLWTIP
jgi:hypothetical protein